MEPIFLILGLVALLWSLSNSAGAASGAIESGGDYTDWGSLFSFSFPDIGSATGEAMAGKSIQQWAEQIKTDEGWYPGSRSYRNNNPGNIVGKVAGAVGTDKDGFAIFPTAQAGMEALNTDLSAKVRKYPDYSLLQIMARYLGGNPKAIPADGNIYVNGKLQGNAIQRANSLAKGLGASVTDTLSSLFGGTANV